MEMKTKNWWRRKYDVEEEEEEEIKKKNKKQKEHKKNRKKNGGRNGGGIMAENEFRPRSWEKKGAPRPATNLTFRSPPLALKFKMKNHTHKKIVEEWRI